MGTAVGVWVGSAVGRVVGSAEGLWVGVLEGAPVGLCVQTGLELSYLAIWSWLLLISLMRLGG